VRSFFCWVFGVAEILKKKLCAYASLEPVPITDPHVVQAFVLVVAKVAVG